MDFRFGNIAGIYYDLLGEKLPRQLDLLNTWFPGLIITEDPSDGDGKTPASYQEREFRIHAVRVHGRLYSGGSTRISQITGRLIGTAAGNPEKERKTAELMQKNIARCFVTDMEIAPRLQENAKKLLGRLTDEQKDLMSNTLRQEVESQVAQRAAMDAYTRITEPFPMDDEAFDGILYNAAYQLHLGTFSGLSNAWLWLLTGSLLRNEIGRVLRLYDSSFVAVRRQISEDGSLEDKLNFLFHPEEYYSTYSGNDLDSLYPGVEWYCDGCGAYLNEQQGFTDHNPEWTCTQCGFVNQIGFGQIYENEEDYHNQIFLVDPEDFASAIEQRRQKLDDNK